MSKKLRYSEKLDCRHCGNVAPMRCPGAVSDTQTEEQDFGPPVEHGMIYEVLICPKCEEPSIRQGHWHDGMEDEDDWHGTIIYPSEPTRVAGLPNEVEREFVAAQKVATVSPNAYAVLLGRVLDVVCDDRNAVGDTLHQRLVDLANRDEIPTNLADMAHKLRQLRNVGAHANLGTITNDEVPVLEALCRAVLEYVYAAPQLVAQVESRLQKLFSN